MFLLIDQGCCRGNGIDINTDELAEKCINGTISENEIKAIHKALINREGDEYQLLLLFGRGVGIFYPPAKINQYRLFIEDYLSCSDDPMFARLAVQILCSYWGLTHEYKIMLGDFIQGVEWDDEEDVRLMAISCTSKLFEKEHWAVSKLKCTGWVCE